VVGKILMAVRAGNYPEVAARWAGVCAATYYRWRKDPRPPYVAFRAALDMADAECEAMVIGNLAKLSRTSTRAARFLLERRWPDEWSQSRRPPPEPSVEKPTAPPLPRLIETRTFSIAELVASQREQAPRRGNGGL
jgi:hypothetical protein